MVEKQISQESNFVPQLAILEIENEKKKCSEKAIVIKKFNFEYTSYVKNALFFIIVQIVKIICALWFPFSN